MSRTLISHLHVGVAKPSRLSALFFPASWVDRKFDQPPPTEHADIRAMKPFQNCVKGLLLMSRRSLICFDCEISLGRLTLVRTRTVFCFKRCMWLGGSQPKDHTREGKARALSRRLHLIRLSIKDKKQSVLWERLLLPLQRLNTWCLVLDERRVNCVVLRSLAQDLRTLPPCRLALSKLRLATSVLVRLTLAIDGK